jgi:hypothetical protein
MSTLNMPEDAALWRMDRTLPRAWIVHAEDVTAFPSLKWPLRSQRVSERTEAVLFPGARARDFLHSAAVETDTVLKFAARSLDTQESCEITHYDPQRVVVEANLAAPALVILSDAWFPGWRAFVTSAGQQQEALIHRTDRVFRGVWLSEGKQTIEFRYESRSFYRGAWISGISWIFLAALALIVSGRGRRPR